MPQLACTKSSAADTLDLSRRSFSQSPSRQNTFLFKFFAIFIISISLSNFYSSIFHYCHSFYFQFIFLFSSSPLLFLLPVIFSQSHRLPVSPSFSSPHHFLVHFGARLPRKAVMPSFESSFVKHFPNSS